MDTPKSPPDPTPAALALANRRTRPSFGFQFEIPADTGDALLAHLQAEMHIACDLITAFLETHVAPDILTRPFLNVEGQAMVARCNAISNATLALARWLLSPRWRITQVRSQPLAANHLRLILRMFPARG